MSDDFTRTETGIVAKWQFHDVPTIWVEGPTDIFFYPPVLRGLKCRLEPFHGCKNAEALIQGILNDDLPYVVILDGDYGIMAPRRSVHRRVVVLTRYSFENYLWHKDSLNYACRRHAQCGEQFDLLGVEMTRLEKHMKDVFRSAVELDVASVDCNPSPKILPDSIEQILREPNNPDVDPQKLAVFIGVGADAIPPESIRRAKRQVREFLDNRQFYEILKGHLLMGIIQKMFCKAASELRGSSASLRQDALVQIISDAVWMNTLDPDYKRLRAKLRKQVKNCNVHPEMVALMSP